MVIGKGDLEETFRQILREGGVADRVNLLGFVPHAETPRFLSAFDILVVPSETQPNWKEQFGRVITEALACGTPVVGSSSGENPRLVDKSEGVSPSFAKGYATDLANTLRKLSDGQASSSKVCRKRSKVGGERGITPSSRENNGGNFGDGCCFSSEDGSSTSQCFVTPRAS